MIIPRKRTWISPKIKIKKIKDKGKGMFAVKPIGVEFGAKITLIRKKAKKPKRPGILSSAGIQIFIALKKLELV
ncbi:MAG: hypothetical protein NTV62_01210 [Candidatus Gribaldobacteria bacterium]|nr:hypothetical protein [Candidatus Gribaldobacteria bacterium]